MLGHPAGSPDPQAIECLPLLSARQPGSGGARLRSTNIASGKMQGAGQRAVAYGDASSVQHVASDGRVDIEP